MSESRARRRKRAATSSPVKLSAPRPDIFVASKKPLEAVLARATHVGVAAHPDDLEIIAIPAIGACYRKKSGSFVGIVCTDGAGSPRGGKYAQATDAGMRRIRREEQRRAARAGRYAALIQLGYPSAAVRKGRAADLSSDLAAILNTARPEALFTHTPADAHDTHVGIACAVIRAVRALSPQRRPKAVYGAAVWRDLDWLGAPYRVEFDVSRYARLQARLLRLFDSQLSGGKRYDRAALAREAAHATYREPFRPDRATHVVPAMDLTPLVRPGGPSVSRYVRSALRGLQRDATRRLARVGRIS